MPLTAIYRLTGEKLLSSLEDEARIVALREEANTNNIERAFVCPFCDGEVRFRKGHTRLGFLVTPHFAHVADVCATTYRYHTESIEHREAKLMLATELPRRYKEYAEAECIVEYRIPEIKRIADVAFRFPDGEIVVHEAQLSKIEIDELQERTQDYNSIGIPVVWHLGPKMHQHANWCQEATGSVGIITINQQLLRNHLGRDN